MSMTDQLTLARLDYELHAGPWPLESNATMEYIAIAHPHRIVDRHLLMDVLAEHLGTFTTVQDLARAVTAQSFLGTPEVDLNGWPFIHIDWFAASATLSDSITEGRLGPIVRVAGTCYFSPANQA
ncbi:hypothetical protein [Microbacterium gorillae]|uniref:hypothetical protein n=1 Tax=Microbacterium gorillae TaxID=1231063 RepID=UPI003D9807FC